MADELFFKTIDILAGADGQACARTAGASAVESDIIYVSDVINVYRITILYGQAGIGRVIRFREGSVSGGCFGCSRNLSIGMNFCFVGFLRRGLGGG